jgi:hypothetical protein
MAMMTIRARTETREIRRAGEKLRIGNGRRIEIVEQSSVWVWPAPAASRKSALFRSKHPNG